MSGVAAGARSGACVAGKGEVQGFRTPGIGVLGSRFRRIKVKIVILACLKSISVNTFTFSTG